MKFALAAFFTAAILVVFMIEANLFFQASDPSQKTLDKWMIKRQRRRQRNARHAQQIRAGRAKARGSKLVVTGLARDVEAALPAIRRFLDLISRDFLDFHLVVFENDSQDQTRSVLKSWPDTTVLDCCEWGSCDCRLPSGSEHLYDVGTMSETRFAKMGSYREKCRKYISEHFSDWDYVLVADLDIGHSDVDGLFHSIGSADEWDAICVNGRSFIPGTLKSATFCYDGLAYVGQDDWMDRQPSPTTKHIVKQTLSMNYGLVGSSLLPVTSAFNGMAIYSMDAFKVGTYTTLNAQVCEHITMHKSMAEAGRGRIFLNQKWFLICPLQGPRPLVKLLKK